MVAFLKFWWDCLVEGVHIGDGIFGVTETICIIIGAGLKWHSHIPYLKKYTEKWEKWEGIVMKWTFAIGLVAFIVSTVLVAPFLELEKHNNQHSASSELTNELAEAKSELQQATNKVAQAEKKAEGYAALLQEALNHPNMEPISKSIREFRIKWDQDWQTNGLKNSSNAAQIVADKRQHGMEQGRLQKLEDKAKTQELIDRVYTVWSETASKFKDMLSKQSTNFGGEVVGGRVPPISEILTNETVFIPIGFKTNSWQCRLEFKKTGYFNIYCQENGKIETALTIHSDENNLSMNLTHIEPDGRYELFSTNYPMSSLGECAGSAAQALQLLIEDQKDQF